MAEKYLPLLMNCSLCVFSYADLKNAENTSNGHKRRRQLHFDKLCECSTLKQTLSSKLYFYGNGFDCISEAVFSSMQWCCYSEKKGLPLLLVYALLIFVLVGLH